MTISGDSLSPIRMELRNRPELSRARRFCAAQRILDGARTVVECVGLGKREPTGCCLHREAETIPLGNTASIASGKPFSPSMQMMNAIFNPQAKHGLLAVHID